MDKIEQLKKIIIKFIYRTIKEKHNIESYYVSEIIIDAINEIKLNDNIYENIINLILTYIDYDVLLHDASEYIDINLKTKQDVIKYLKTQTNYTVLTDPISLLIDVELLNNKYLIYQDIDEKLYDELYFFIEIPEFISRLKYYGLYQII